MGNMIWNLIFFLIAVIITFLVTRHFYLRSVDKELVPFLQFQSDVLDQIDDEVKSDLEIKYKGIKVDRLQQIQFLVANTGEKAIKELIKPLSLKIKGKVSIMDAKILYIHPKGREVTLILDKTNNTVNFNFPLLNKDDFFIVKFLINGSPKKSDYGFSITADDFPPNLSIQRLSYRQITSDKKDKEGKRKIEFRIIPVGLAFLFFSACIMFSSYFSTFPHVTSEGFEWVNNIPIEIIANVVGYITGLLLSVIGIGFILSAFGEIEFPKKKKFVLPKELTSTGIGLDFLFDENITSSAKKAIEDKEE